MSLTTALPSLTAMPRSSAWTGLQSSNASIAWQVDDSADPPYHDLSLKPLNAGGLWLAVIITPPTALCAFTANDTPGVGVGSADNTTSKPLPAKISATRRPN